MPGTIDFYSKQLESAVSRVTSGAARIVVPESVGLHRRRPGAHFHPTPEFFLQIGGGSEFECPSGGFRLKTGDICVMPAGVPHAETALNLRTPYRILVLMREAEGFIALQGTTNAAGQIQSADMRGFERGGMAFQCLELVSRAQTLHRSLRGQYIKALTTAFLAAILSEIRNPSSGTLRIASPLVVEAERLVRVEISRLDLSVQSVAVRIGCSPDHLTRLFRCEHGMSLGVWIAKERLQLARDLLSHPEHNIAEVGLTCGFASPSYFIRVFKAYTGSTPKAWRIQTSSVRPAGRAQGKMLAPPAKFSKLTL
ncbi:MAG: helix-turn-helix domain-containing protein [Verrucomicrobiota bacterium]